MNGNRKEKTALALKSIGAPAGLSPNEAFAWMQDALRRAYERSLDPVTREAGLKELASLRKADKAVIYANTDWRQVVDNALHLAGFEDAESYDRRLSEVRRAHAAY
jgi:hypothetical protein